MMLKEENERRKKVFGAFMACRLCGAASEAWVIPIIQYEWKHLSDADNAAVIARLQSLGYCTLRVHYDLLAYHAATMEQGGIADRCDVEFAVTRP